MYCIVQSPFTKGKELGAQLALHVQIWAKTPRQEETLCFYDTTRGHMIPGSVAKIEDNAITWKDKNGELWKLREVTMQEYRHRLARSIYNGEEIAKTIKSTEDLWEFYRKTFPI